MENLKKKYGNWGIITGASSGIGEEFARKFAAIGINLILVARREDKLKKIADELRELNNVEIIYVVQDLSEDNFIDSIAEAAKGKEVGILINNAGMGCVGEFNRSDSSYEEKLIKVNCIAPMILTRRFVDQMIIRKRGAVIFLGSLLSFQPTPYSATYSATKAFNLFLGDALWYELNEYNIDVLSLNPGGTDTEFLRLSNRYKKGPILRSPKQVVETALKALGRKPTVIDGFINKTAVVLGKLLPRKLLVNLSGIISGKLNEERKADASKK